MSPRERNKHGATSSVRFGGALLGAAALLTLAAAQAGAAELGPTVRATGQSPFSGCTADRVAEQSGVNYPNTEIEPWLAANPRNPRNLLIGVQQDRWSNGGARGNAAVFSKDGGRTWKTVAPPKISLCSGGRYQRASDPWVDFSPNGTAYFMSLVTDNDPPSGAFGKNGMVVNRSTDGGATWSPSIQLSALPVGQSLDDKNSLTADPTNSNFVYAVWDRLTDFSLPPEVRGGGAAGARARAKFLADRAKAGAQKEDIPVFFTGPTFLSRTTDGGRTWSAPRKIYDPGDNQQTINNLIVVQPNGTVFDFFTHVYPTGEANIEVIRSTDKGRTWGRPTIVANIFTIGTTTPDEGAPVRDASILFDVAVDPENGSLHVAWQDARFGAGPADQIAYTTSTDGGRRWSRPAWVNLTPFSPNLLRQQAFVPSIEVGPGGVLVVTHYDFRNDNDAAELTDHWAVLCDSRREDCRDAFKWDTEARLSPRSFDMLDAPIARGHFLGDYLGLARAGNAVHPVWGVATADDVTNLFTRRITFGGGAVAGDASAAATVAAKKAAEADD